jgi:hypothetical protein
MINANTVNIKWTFAKLADGYKPFEIPEEIISVKQTELQSLKLSTFVTVTDAPLEIKIKTIDGGKTVTLAKIKEILLDKYLNYYY